MSPSDRPTNNSNSEEGADDQLAAAEQEEKRAAAVELVAQVTKRMQGRQIDYPAVIEQLTRAIELDPALAAAHWQRGVAFLGQGLPRLARADLTRARQLEPGNAQILLLRARANLQMLEYGAARLDSRRVIQLNPNDAAAYALHGVALAGLGRLAEAEKSLSEYTDHGGSDEATVALDCLRHAQFLLEKSNKPEAAFLTRKAAQFDPSISLPVPPHLASARQALQDDDPLNVDQAVADLTQALAQNPRLGEAYLLRGKLYLQRGMPLLALADLAQARKFSLRDYEVFLLQARANLQVQRYPMVLTVSEQAIQLRPEQRAAYADRGVALGALRYEGEAERCFAELKRLGASEAELLAVADRCSAEADLLTARDAEDYGPDQKPPPAARYLDQLAKNLRQTYPTRNYWQALQGILAELRQRSTERSAAPDRQLQADLQAALQATERISRLPTSNVDPAAVEIGKDVSELLLNTQFVLKRLEDYKDRQDDATGSAPLIDDLTNVASNLLKRPLQSYSVLRVEAEDLDEDQHEVWQQTRGLLILADKIRRTGQTARQDLAGKYGLEFVSLQ